MILINKSHSTKEFNILCAVFISLFISQISTAQTLLFSSVGSLKGISNNSTSVNFKSSATCIDIQSGVAVFSAPRGFGEFAINCDIKQQFNKLGIKMYPNPAKSITKLKFDTTPPLTEKFNISIWNTEGFLVSSRIETGYSIFQGLNIDLNSLVSGSFILKVESAGYLDAIKFIKVN